MSLLEAISPTARLLLGKMGGGRMNSIVKATTHGHALRVHVKLGYNKTLCGLLLDPCQLDLAEPNCKRCAACQQRSLRMATTGRAHRPRSTVRLNGRKVSINQVKLIP